MDETPHLKAMAQQFCEAIGHPLPDGMRRARRLSESGLLPKTRRGHTPPPATEYDCATYFLGLVASPIATDAAAAALSRGALRPSRYEAVAVDPETGRETRHALDRKPKDRHTKFVDRLAAYILAGRKPETRAIVNGIVQTIRIYQAAPCAIMRCQIEDNLLVEEIYLPDSEAAAVRITENDLRNVERCRSGKTLSPAIEIAPDVLFLFSEILNGEHAPSIKTAARPERATTEQATTEQRAAV